MRQLPPCPPNKPSSKPSVISHPTETKLIKASLRALTAIERVTSSIAAFFMFAIMIIVFSDVVMRYVFNRPFSWAYDLISLYIMAGVFFLSLSGTYAVNGHISVDILLPRFSAIIQRVCIIISNLVGLAIFIPITWLGYQRALDNFTSGDVLAGAIPWPTWASAALVPVGAGILALRLAVHLVANTASLLTGEDLLPLPAISGHSIEKAGGFE
jgi:TRAP-type C4-dicarboxylate transport system permease small subunit